MPYTQHTGSILRCVKTKQKKKQLHEKQKNYFKKKIRSIYLNEYCLKKNREKSKLLVN